MVRVQDTDPDRIEVKFVQFLLLLNQVSSRKDGGTQWVFTIVLGSEML